MEVAGLAAAGRAGLGAAAAAGVLAALDGLVLLRYAVDEGAADAAARWWQKQLDGR